jgi:hypothetical protein
MNGGHENMLLSLRSEHEAVVDLLEAAGETPVSFADLADRGTGKPATVVYELQAVGYPVERVIRLDGEGRRCLAGVRLRLERRPEPSAAARPVRAARRLRAPLRPTLGA